MTVGLPAHELRRLRRVVNDEAQLDHLVRRRLGGEPLQYLEGTVQFGPIELKVDGRALIPRPETEWLWEMAVFALEEAGPGTVIVDLCTGSGNLALALKSAFPEARVCAADISAEAIELASENAARLGLEVELLQGDLFEALPSSIEGRLDLLVANPPYVSVEEFPTLPADVRDHEPWRALVAGPSGNEVLARIADEAYRWLGMEGWIFCEIAEQRAERALELFSVWFDCEVRTDLAGRPRVLVARKGASCCG